MECPDLSAKRLGKVLPQPLDGLKPSPLLPCFVHFAVRACHKAFQILTSRRFGGERGQLGQACGGALIEVVESLNFLQDQFQIRLCFKAIQNGLEFGPDRAFGADETLEIDDHSNCCLLYTSDAADERSSVDL